MLSVEWVGRISTEVSDFPSTEVVEKQWSCERDAEKMLDLVPTLMTTKFQLIDRDVERPTKKGAAEV